jgi:hypothetical protein
MDFPPFVMVYHKQTKSPIHAEPKHREREHLPLVHRKRMEIAVDRQEHTINWMRASDKWNVRLLALASADIKSGYVFGFHLNYDPSHNIEDIEKAATDCGDYDVRNPFRQHARFWLVNDYIKSIANSSTSLKRTNNGRSAVDLVQKTYLEAIARNDIEASDEMSVCEQLPKIGMQIHCEYTMYAHFFFLKTLLKSVDYFEILSRPGFRDTRSLSLHLCQ